MDITQYRLDQFEKRADAADARMARIEDKLTEMQVTMATLATKDNVRNWGLAVVIASLAIGVSVGGIVVASSSNQLSAFPSQPQRHSNNRRRTATGAYGAFGNSQVWQLRQAVTAVRDSPDSTAYAVPRRSRPASTTK